MTTTGTNDETNEYELDTRQEPPQFLLDFFGNSMKTDFAVTLEDVEKERVEAKIKKEERKEKKKQEALLLLHEKHDDVKENQNPNQNLNPNRRQRIQKAKLNEIPEYDDYDSDDLYFERFGLDDYEPPPSQILPKQESILDKLKPVKRFDKSTVDRSKKPLDKDPRIAHLVRGIPHKKNKQAKRVRVQKENIDEIRLIQEDKITEAMKPDFYSIKHQNFACISFIFESTYSTLYAENNDVVYKGDLIKVRGVFRTRENADKFIKEVLLKNDPHTEVFLMKCFSWNYPESEMDDDQTETDKKNIIRSLLGGYFENQNKDILDLDERRDMVQQNVNRTKKTADYFFDACEERYEEKKNKKSTIDIINSESDSVVKVDLNELKEILEDDEQVVSTETKNFVIQIEEDKMKIKGQNWVCVTSISKETYRSRNFPNEKFDRPLIKIRGIFDTRYDAEYYIQNRIQHSDLDFDVDLLGASKWSPISDYAYDQNVHVNSQITSLVTGYLNNQNDQISSHPKDRVMQAKSMRSEALQNDENLHSLPFDTQMIATAKDENAGSKMNKSEASKDTPDSALYISDVYEEELSETIDTELVDIDNQPKGLQSVVRLLDMTQKSKDRKKQDFLTYKNILCQDGEGEEEAGKNLNNSGKRLPAVSFIEVGEEEENIEGEEAEEEEELDAEIKEKPTLIFSEQM